MTSARRRNSAHRRKKREKVLVGIGTASGRAPGVVCGGPGPSLALAKRRQQHRRRKAGGKRLGACCREPSVSWNNGMINSRLMSRRKTSGGSGSRSDEESVG